MDTFQFIQHLAVALAIGLMIGIERGWKQREEAEGERAAGLRTLALAGLLGGVWGAMAQSFGAWGVLALGLAFAVFTAAIVLFRWREIEHAKSYGATTAVAAMLAFSLGAFAMVDMVAAAAAGVATAMLLALKTALHGWLKRLTWEELRAGLVLLAMTVILLPILPDREIGPLGALNPHEIWLMTITIAALSFAGYVAIRVAGPERGAVLSGLAGGLVSSTAVTVTMAKLGRDHPERQRPCASASLLASTMMALRVLVVASSFNMTLVRWLLPTLGPAVLVQILFAGMLLHWRRNGGETRGRAAAADEPARSHCGSRLRRPPRGHHGIGEGAHGLDGHNGSDGPRGRFRPCRRRRHHAVYGAAGAHRPCRANGGPRYSARPWRKLRIESGPSDDGRRPRDGALVTTGTALAIAGGLAGFWLAAGWDFGAAGQ